MSKYKLRGFWKVEVVIEEPSIRMFKSKKLIEVEGSSTVHFKVPQLLSRSLKLFHAFV